MINKEMVEKAIAELDKDIKLTFTGLELSNLTSPSSSLKRKYYKEDHFIKDLNIYLPIKFESLKSKQIPKIWKQFKKIFKNTNIFSNILDFQEYSYQIYTKCFDIIKIEIINRLKKLTPEENFNVYIFLKSRDIFNYENKIDAIILHPTLNEFSKREYDHSIAPNIGDILIRTGLLFLSSYINTSDQPTGLYYKRPKYLVELASLIIKYLLKEKSFLNLLKKKEQFIVCKNCEAEYPSQEKFCPICGSENLTISENREIRPLNSNNDKINAVKHLISSFESKIREFIKDQLEQFYGEDWWGQGVPGEIRNIVNDRKIRREEGQPNRLYLLIDFLSFTDYKNIILYRNNWNNIFKQIFKEKRYILSPFDNLKDIRDDLAHNRFRERDYDRCKIYIDDIKKFLPD